MTDPLAERVRKLGGLTLHSSGEISRLQRIKDNDGMRVEPHLVLAELRDDNIQLQRFLRETNTICDDHNDIATAGLLEVYMDETERRTWSLCEAARCSGAD